MIKPATPLPLVTATHKETGHKIIIPDSPEHLEYIKTACNLFPALVAEISNQIAGFELELDQDWLHEMSDFNVKAKQTEIIRLKELLKQCEGVK